MRLCTFRVRGEGSAEFRLGLVRGEKVFEARGSPTFADFLRQGGVAESLAAAGPGVGLGRVELSAPVPRPGKILAAIVNTKAMLGGDDVGLDRPRLDMKAPSAVVGPEATVRSPVSGIRPEVELAAVLGTKLSKASDEEAGRGILGYTVLNDVTAPRDSKEDAYEAYRRDRTTGEIRRSSLRGPLFRSKNHDTFCPMGPWVVTPGELGGDQGLKMSTKFDGALVQSGSTAEYIFSPRKIVSYASGFLTLEPGDVVSCGSVGWTPEALGRLDPTEYVLPSRGGVLELEIEKVGTLRNPVVPE
jgi:2-keto-4-pentenoate hydratase/2-oxohepta-3-ene-1,7-dioic acid hydratase in catechol pathway